MTLLLFYVGLALGVSFICSVMEAVLLSITPSFVAIAERDGNPIGVQIAELKRDIDRPLSAILSLNTIAHTVGAAGAGAQAAVVFESVPIAVISGLLTLAILIISEIIPKTLGAVYWKPLTPWVMRMLVPTILAMWPLVKMSQVIAAIIAPRKQGATVSREQLTALAHIGSKEGSIEEGELRMLGHLLALRDITVRDVMTPRTVVFALPSSMTVDEVLATHHDIRFSRIPVHGSSRDHVEGYVLKNDILLAAARNEGKAELNSMRRPLEVVPESLALPRLLERLLDKRDHIALVVDEFGGAAGVITMEDVVETLLGLEIVDEADSVTDMQELARRNWVKRAKRLGLVDENGNAPAAPSDMG